MQLSFSSQDLISNSPYCLTLLLMSIWRIWCWINYFILTTSMLDIVLILYGEILSWSLVGSNLPLFHYKIAEKMITIHGRW